MIKAWIKKPGEKWEHKEIENDIKVMQDIIGGYLEAVMGPGVAILCDEEGLLKKLPFNTTVLGHAFVGPIIIVGYKNGEITDCEVSQKALQNIF